MRGAILSTLVGGALAFSATAASASVTLGSMNSFCSPAGCTAGTSTASVTDNVGVPNRVQFDNTNAGTGTQTAWFNFFVTPSMLGTFSATVATNPASTVTLLELLTAPNGTTMGAGAAIASTPGTQLTYGNLVSGQWYTFRYTANMATSGNVSGNAAFYPVPEPATWALMLLGFGGIGMAMRRRRRPALVQVA
jgi:hypothetical protein